MARVAEGAPGWDALEGASATLLLTLAARAVADRVVDRGAFDDPQARRIAAASPRDLSGFVEDAGFVRGVVLRSMLLDRMTVDFLAAHPRGRVVTLGAGLCTRRSRVGGGTDWLHVDLPDAIALRERLVHPEPGERNLAASILDPAWMETAGLPGDRPVLLLLEGVCPYLPQAALETSLRALAARFDIDGAVGELVFDHVHPVVASLPTRVGDMHLPVLSGFEDSAGIVSLHPSFKLVSEDHPFGDFSPGHAQFEAMFRATTGQWPYAIVRLALGTRDAA